MGGDDSQKLGPGGEFHSSPGRSKPSVHSKTNTLHGKRLRLRQVRSEAVALSGSSLSIRIHDGFIVDLILAHGISREFAAG